MCNCLKLWSCLAGYRWFFFQLFRPFFFFQLFSHFFSFNFSVLFCIIGTVLYILFVADSAQISFFICLNLKLPIYFWEWHVKRQVAQTLAFSPWNQDSNLNMVVLPKRWFLDKKNPPGEMIHHARMLVSTWKPYNMQTKALWVKLEWFTMCWHRVKSYCKILR